MTTTETKCPPDCVEGCLCTCGNILAVHMVTRAPFESDPNGHAFACPNAPTPAPEPQGWVGEVGRMPTGELDVVTLRSERDAIAAKLAAAENHVEELQDAILASRKEQR